MTSIATVSTDALSLLSLEEARLANSHAAKWEKLYHCHREFSFSSAITQRVCSELSSKSFDFSHPRPRLFRYHAKLRSRGTFDFRWCIYNVPMLVRTQWFRERRVRINFEINNKSKYSGSPSERRRTSAAILEFLYSDLTFLALPANKIAISFYSNRSVLANEKNSQRFETFKKKNWGGKSCVRWNSIFWTYNLYN